MSGEVKRSGDPGDVIARTGWKQERRPRRESSLERYFVARCREIGAIPMKIQRLRGWPDRLVLWPGGEVDFVELKAPGGKVAPMQTWVHEKLRQYAFDVYCFSDRLEIERYLARRKTW